MVNYSVKFYGSSENSNFFFPIDKIFSESELKIISLNIPERFARFIEISIKVLPLIFNKFLFLIRLEFFLLVYTNCIAFIFQHNYIVYSKLVKIKI